MTNRQSNIAAYGRTMRLIGDFAAGCYMDRNNIHVRWDADAQVWVCDRAKPQIWVSTVFLGSARQSRAQALEWRTQALASGIITEDEPDTGFFGPWFVEPDGEEIKLKCANGFWVWRLTGRTRYQDLGIAPEYEAVWPD